MSRMLTLAVLGFAGFSLAAPQVTQAQTPVGVGVQVGPVGLSYQSGNPYIAPGCVAPAQPVLVAPPAVVVAPPIVVRPPLVYPYRAYGYGYARYPYAHYRHGYVR